MESHKVCEPHQRMHNVCMQELSFEWNEHEAKINHKKHGITFDEDKTAFYDERAMVFFDPDNSDDEERYLLLGTSHKLNQVIVCHCFRESETVIRIFSARKADKDESLAYWAHQS